MNDIQVTTISSHFADVVFEDGYNTYTFTNAIQYREDATPVVQTVSPKNGDVFGQYNI